MTAGHLLLRTRNKEQTNQQKCMYVIGTQKLNIIKLMDKVTMDKDVFGLYIPCVASFPSFKTNLFQNVFKNCKDWRFYLKNS